MVNSELFSSYTEGREKKNYNCINSNTILETRTSLSLHIFFCMLSDDPKVTFHRVLVLLRIGQSNSQSVSQLIGTRPPNKLVGRYDRFIGQSISTADIHTHIHTCTYLSNISPLEALQ